MDFLNEFCETIGLDDYYLAGNSLGGEIAWNYTLKNQSKINGLILIDPSGYSNSNDKPMAFKLAKTPVISSLLKYITPKSFIKKSIKDVYYDDTKITESLITRYHDLALREGNRQAFIDRANTVNLKMSDSLSLIRTPTLIIWGKYDQWIPIELSKKYHQNITNSELYILDSGHIPMEENPNITVNKTIEFMNANTTQEL